MVLKADELFKKTVKTDVPVFRDRLREALTDRDMSQRQLAISMNKDPRTVNHVFKGPVHPDLGTLKEFCQKLDVSADWLLGLSESKDEKPRPQTLHRFNHMNDIRDHDKRAYSTTSYSHPDIAYIAMAPMTSDNFEPNIRKGDLLAIDMSHNTVTQGALYVTSWANSPEDLYVNYMFKTVENGVDKWCLKWLANTKAAQLGMQDKVLDAADMICHGVVVGKYSTSII